VDNLEEVFENREQIEISKFYERMPKPTTTATEEFLEGKLTYRMREQGLEEGKAE
jgi:DNA-directed RNA polymerase subunit K/omega